MLFLDQWVRSVLNQESKKMKPGNKCTWIQWNILLIMQSQFLFVMEKSILYSKITVSQKNSLKTQFQMLYGPFIFIVIIMSKILINV